MSDRYKFVGGFDNPKFDMTKKEFLPSGVLKSLGLVFGDIDTIPIYTSSDVYLLTQPTPERVIGVLSLIVWTLVDIVYLFSNTYKIPYGGYWSIILAAILVRHHHYLYQRTEKVTSVLEAANPGTLCGR